MKKFFFILFCFPLLSFAQQSGDDLSSSDGLIRAFYSCLDVQKGGKIDSARFTNLFWKGAQLDGVFQSRKDSSKFVNYRITIPEYLKMIEELCATHRFKEWELTKKTLSYGHLVTVYSAYELIDIDEKGDTISQRGINTFQLFNDGKRWWITYCSYEDETIKNPLPAEYLPAEKKK